MVLVVIVKAVERGMYELNTVASGDQQSKRLLGMLVSRAAVEDLDSRMLWEGAEVAEG